MTEVGFILSNSLFAASFNSPGAIVVQGTLSGDAIHRKHWQCPISESAFTIEPMRPTPRERTWVLPSVSWFPSPLCLPHGGQARRKRLQDWRVSSWFGAFRPYEQRLDISCRPWLAVRPTGRRGRALGLERRPRLGSGPTREAIAICTKPTPTNGFTS